MILKSKIKSSLFALLTQINEAAASRLDLLAISMVVALPDICVSLISANGRTTGAKYKAWCAANLKAGFESVTPDDLWKMRCGVLHSGRYGDLKHSVARVIFIPAGDDVFVDCIGNDAYFYSVVSFCNGINRAVVAWYEANHQHPNVVANIDRLVQYRVGGLHPYISGKTVVA